MVGSYTQRVRTEKPLKIHQNSSKLFFKSDEVKTFQIDNNWDNSWLVDGALKKHCRAPFRTTCKTPVIHKKKQRVLVKATTQPKSRWHKCKSLLFLSDFKGLHEAIITKPC